MLAIEIQEDRSRRSAGPLFGYGHARLIEYARYGRFQQYYPDAELSEREFRMRWVQHSDRRLVRKHGIAYEREVFPLVAQSHLSLGPLHTPARGQMKGSKPQQQALLVTEDDAKDIVTKLFTPDTEEALDKLITLLDVEGSIFAPQSIGVYAHTLKAFRMQLQKVLLKQHKRDKQLSQKKRREL